MNVTVAEMKSNLSRLLRKAEGGEEVIVTRHGKVVARLLPPEEPLERKPSLLGAFEGKSFRMADDFDELGPEWDEYVK